MFLLNWYYITNNILLVSKDTNFWFLLNPLKFLGIHIYIDIILSFSNSWTTNWVNYQTYLNIILMYSYSTASIVTVFVLNIFRDHDFTQFFFPIMYIIKTVANYIVCFISQQSLRNKTALLCTIVLKCAFITPLLLVCGLQWSIHYIVPIPW